MIVKVCGITNVENLRQVDCLGIDMTGHIFYPKSPRFVSEIENIPHPVHALSVGVFVNQSIESILRTAKIARLDYIQLHGRESPEVCRTLSNEGIRVIKAFTISEAEDLSAVNAYEDICDYYLFDTKCPSYGGSGVAFDWNILQCYTGQTPFLLSGGIGIDSIHELMKFSHPMLAGYDLNSRFETSPGIKSIGLLAEFLQELKNIDKKAVNYE